MIAEDGYVLVMGRKRDIIIRSGQNMHPVEIEQFPIGLSGIREAALVGVPAEVNGEAIWAFLVPEKATRMNAREVKDYCGESVEPCKIPTEVSLVVDYQQAKSGEPQEFRLRKHAMRRMPGKNRQG